MSEIEEEKPPPKQDKDVDVTRRRSVISDVVDSPSVQFVWSSITSLCGSLLVLLGLLIAFGALIQAFEAEQEIEDNLAFQEFINDLRTRDGINETDIQAIADFAGRDLEEGLEGFSTFDGEARWRGKDIEAFVSSVSYAFDLASTIGYGAIPAQTRGGRAISIVAIIVLIPLTVVAYTRLAEFIENKIGNVLISRDKEYKDVVEKYDKDKDGSIDTNELQDILKDLGVQITQERVNELLRQFDASKDNKLNEEEFRQLCIDLRLRLGLLASPNLRLNIALGLFIFYIIIFTFITFAAFVDNLFDSFYFVIITVSTVGLGDVVPPQELRGVFSLLAFFGIGFMALVLKAIVDIIYTRTDLRLRRQQV